MPTRQLTHQTHLQPPLQARRTRAKLPPGGTEAASGSSRCPAGCLLPPFWTYSGVSSIPYHRGGLSQVPRRSRSSGFPAEKSQALTLQGASPFKAPANPWLEL